MAKDDTYWPAQVPGDSGSGGAPPCAELVRVLTEQHHKDKAEMGLEEQCGTKEIIQRYAATVRTQVLMTLRQWLLEYFYLDFAEDEPLQQALHGLIVSMRERQQSADADELCKAWIRARRALEAATKGERSYRDFARQELDEQLRIDGSSSGGGGGADDEWLMVDSGGGMRRRNTSS